MARGQEPVHIQNPEMLCRSYAFARRMSKTPKSFIREILKVTENPGIISFTGGLPSPDLIDVWGISQAAAAVLREDGRTALQYSTTEGYLPLRRFIADRYKKRLGLDVSPEEILITNGSQQCLDLIGKILIDPKDRVAIERLGYLGAIQVFSLYEPVFVPVELHRTGPTRQPSKQRWPVTGRISSTASPIPRTHLVSRIGGTAERVCRHPFRHPYACGRGRCVRRTSVFGQSPPAV